MEPLAQRLRPRTLDEVCGQQHLLGKNQVFRRTVDSGRIPNMIFYGPSGVGKTTVASIIAAGSGMRLHKLNGTTAGTADIKAVLADIGTLGASGGILLYLDEISISTNGSSKACWNVLSRVPSPLSPPPPRTRIFMSTTPCFRAARCLSSRR